MWLICAVVGIGHVNSLIYCCFVSQLLQKFLCAGRQFSFSLFLFLLPPQGQVWLLEHRACISACFVHSHVPIPDSFMCLHSCSCVVHLCVGTCVYVWVWRPEVNLSSHSLGVLFLRQDLSLTTDPPGIHMPPYRRYPGITNTCYLVSFVSWVLELNEGPLACKISSLLTEPSTQPPFLILKTCDWHPSNKVDNS